MLNKKDLKDLIETARLKINLSQTVLEKDYWVTQLIHAASKIENEYFRLVFCGGTCLAKAHKIVKRMSEDLDFKIQLKNTNEIFSRSHLTKELKQFRNQIMSSLVNSDLKINDFAVRNEGKYSRIELNYPISFPGNNGLRPNILLEFTLSNILLKTEILDVNTIIEDTLAIPPLFSSTPTHCLSINETAIEKWVGLTRRIAAIERGYHHDDKTLIRHVYDLNAIINDTKFSAKFFNLAKVIICHDIEQVKNQHPEYAIDPATEIKKSLELLRNKLLWRERYSEFIETMTYSNNTQPYTEALDAIEKISLQIISTLGDNLIPSKNYDVINN